MTAVLDLSDALTRMSGRPFPQELVDDAESIFRTRRLAAGELFARPGDVGSPVGIVVTGLLRLVYADETGRDRTYDFRGEGDLVCAYAANLGRGPAQFAIEALEPTQVRVLAAQRFAELVRRHPAWAELIRRRTEQLYVAGEQRQRSLLTADAAARYREFVAGRPELAERLSRRVLASYLAMAPETLSRVGGP